MKVTSETVKELRERTQAGMMDCKNVLVETNGNIEKAIVLLREKGLSKAAKKSGRIASEGLVDAYIHGGRIGVLIEINSETDFVAKTDDFKNFVKDMAMQVAATNPRYVSREEVPENEIEKEREILTHQALNEGKPEHVVKKMVEGRLDKFFEQICLLDQNFIKNPDVKIRDLLNEKISKIGENIKIRRFVRYEVGEGLEKKEENFAEEVAKQIKS